jgi:hypothetical protein
MYDIIFEESFVESSKVYYTKKSIDFIHTSTCFDYLNFVNEVLQIENGFIVDVLYGKSKDNLLDAIKSVLIGDRMDEILGKNASGLVYMLANDHLEQLSLLYKIVHLVPSGPNALKLALSNYINDRGLELNSSNPTVDSDMKTENFAWFHAFLCIQMKFDVILKEAFCSDLAFKQDVNSALQDVVNKNPKSPELVSFYANYLLKLESKGVSFILIRN